MSENPNNAISDEEIAKRTGFATEETTVDEESTDDSDDADDVNDDIDSEADEEPEETDEEESSDEEDDDDSDDSDDDSDDDDDNDSQVARKRTVPYSKLKTERDKVKTLKTELDQIGEIKTALSEVKTLLSEIQATKNSSNSQETNDEIDLKAEELAKEIEAEGTEIDPKTLAKILKMAVTLTEKKFDSKIPKGLEDKIKQIDEFNDKNKNEDQTDKIQSEFNKEWEPISIKFKRLYPNATDEMIADAKKEMYKLAHSKKFHTYDIMDIYHSPKNKKIFDTLLKVSPSNRSGERAKNYKVGDGDDAQKRHRDVNIEEMTPEIMRAREAEERDINNSSDKVKDYKINNPKH